MWTAKRGSFVKCSRWQHQGCLGVAWGALRGVHCPEGTRIITVLEDTYLRCGVCVLQRTQETAQPSHGSARRERFELKVLRSQSQTFTTIIGCQRSLNAEGLQPPAHVTPQGGQVPGPPSEGVHRQCRQEHSRHKRRVCGQVRKQ